MPASKRQDFRDAPSNGSSTGIDCPLHAPERLRGQIGDVGEGDVVPEVVNMSDRISGCRLDPGALLPENWIV
jgi:hypothetical protein